VPTEIALVSTTQSVAIDFTTVGYVSEMLGNGRRDIVPHAADVITYPDGSKYVVIRGPLIKKNGTRGSYRSMRWCIGGRNDQSDIAPAIVHEILKAGSWLS
jgi:hypothetical protein